MVSLGARGVALSAAGLSCCWGEFSIVALPLRRRRNAQCTGHGKALQYSEVHASLHTGHVWPAILNVCRGTFITAQLLPTGLDSQAALLCHSHAARVIACNGLRGCWLGSFSAVRQISQTCAGVYNFRSWGPQRAWPKCFRAEVGALVIRYLSDFDMMYMQCKHVHPASLPPLWK